jgi:cytoskeletal protein CcmA (bactofilin family)
MFGNKPGREIEQKEIPIRLPERAPERPVAEPVMEQKNNSIFGKGSRMNGTLKCEGGIRIDGEFEGTIESSDTLVIGKEGAVRANAKVKRAVIGGRFEGNINATGKVELHSGCEMLGEVETPSLVIEEGVVFEGTCKMGTSKGTARQMAAGIARDAAHAGMSSSGGGSRPTAPAAQPAQSQQGQTQNPTGQPPTFAQKP